MLCSNPSGGPGCKECVDLAVLRRDNDNGAEGDRVIIARTPYNYQYANGFLYLDIERLPLIHPFSESISIFSLQKFFPRKIPTKKSNQNSA